MATRDAPIRRAVDELEGLITLGEYVAQGTGRDLKLQLPRIAADNSGHDPESVFLCYWDTNSGTLVFVPLGADDVLDEV